jgi:hypothetical protein
VDLNLAHTLQAEGKTYFKISTQKEGGSGEEGG